jgi:hypothetical protein
VRELGVSSAQFARDWGISPNRSVNVREARADIFRAGVSSHLTKPRSSD